MREIGIGGISVGEIQHLIQEPQAMNKSEMVSRIAQITGLRKAQVRAVLDEFIHTVAEGMRQGERVSLNRFGTFFSRARAARSFRNPRTGQLEQASECRRAAFHASKTIHAWVNLDPEQMPPQREPRDLDPDQLDMFGL